MRHAIGFLLLALPFIVGIGAYLHLLAQKDGWRDILITGAVVLATLTSIGTGAYLIVF